MGAFCCKDCFDKKIGNKHRKDHDDDELYNCLEIDFSDDEDES